MNTDTCKSCTKAIKGDSTTRIFCDIYKRTFDKDAWCPKFELNIIKTNKGK